MLEMNCIILCYDFIIYWIIYNRREVLILVINNKIDVYFDKKFLLIIDKSKILSKSLMECYLLSKTWNYYLKVLEMIIVFNLNIFDHVFPDKTFYENLKIFSSFGCASWGKLLIVWLCHFCDKVNTAFIFKVIFEKNAFFNNFLVIIE